MKATNALTLAILTLATLGVHAQTPMNECKSDENFNCSPTNPEDLLPIPGTPLVLVSSMENTGHLSASNTNDLSNRVLFPTPTAKKIHNKKQFPDCPGPVSIQFRPHGLALREGDNNTHTLYVIGHGEREAVEVFTLNANNATAELTWVGCVVAPEGVSLNSVAPLPDGAFAVTNFNLNEGGQVWEWQLNAGWNKVPGSEMYGPNGLIASRDGKWLYIGGWQDEALIKLSRNSSPGNKQPVEKQLVAVGFHIDNVRWGAGDTILVAGQKGSRADVRACLYEKNCSNAATGIALIDEKSLLVLATHELPSSEEFILGTVAISVNDGIWVGGIAGAQRIARFQFSN